MALQPMAGGEDDASLFGRGNAGGGTAVVAAATLAHFDKDSGRAMAGNQVDFPALDAEVALKHDEPLPGKKLRRTRLGRGALGRRCFVLACQQPP